MSKPIRVPREVQRAAWYMMSRVLEDAREATSAQDLHPNEDVCCEAWQRVCDSLQALCEKRGGDS